MDQTNENNIFNGAEVEYLDEWNGNDDLDIASGSSELKITRRASSGNEEKFVQALASVGRALLEKSQAPAVKKKKKIAAEKMCELLLTESAEIYTPSQIVKKVANLKQRLKAKTDLKRTGNLPVHLKKFEELFMDLLNAEDNPSITPLKCGFELGVNQSRYSRKPEDTPTDLDVMIIADSVPVSSDSTMASTKKKRSFSETKSTHFDNNALQNSVLKNQLELIDMQKSLFTAQEQRQQEVHAEEMKLFALKKKVLEAKLLAFEKI